MIILMNAEGGPAYGHCVPGVAGHPVGNTFFRFPGQVNGFSGREGVKCRIQVVETGVGIYTFWGRMVL